MNETDRRYCKPDRADKCPYWVWEETDVWGIGKGHCSARFGSNSVDHCDPCCGAGFRDNAAEVKQKVKP